MGFSRQESWSGFPFLPPGILPPQGLLMGLSLTEVTSILSCASWESLCLLGRHLSPSRALLFLGLLAMFFWHWAAQTLCFGHEFLVGMFDCKYIFPLWELSFSFVYGFLFCADTLRLIRSCLVTLDLCFIILRSGAQKNCPWWMSTCVLRIFSSRMS